MLASLPMRSANVNVNDRGKRNVDSASRKMVLNKSHDIMGSSRSFPARK